MSVKINDLTYPSPPVFLEICNTPISSKETPFFTKALLLSSLTDCELEVCSALGLSLSYKTEPNGDQGCHLHKLYQRFASAASILPKTREYEMGQYLLYISTFSAGMVSAYTNVQRVCACIQITLRIIRDDKSWSTHLQQVTTLAETDFRDCSFDLARKYVDLINAVKPWQSGEVYRSLRSKHKYSTLIRKFEHSQHL